MSEVQLKRCTKCGEVKPWSEFYLRRKTSEARGWLCNKCNAGLGALGDNPRILENALVYLRERGSAPTRPRFR